MNRLERPDRRRFSRAYLVLYEEVVSIFDRHDPVGLIASGSPRQRSGAGVPTPPAEASAAGAAGAATWPGMTLDIARVRLARLLGWCVLVPESFPCGP